MLPQTCCNSPALSPGLVSGKLPDRNGGGSTVADLFVIEGQIIDQPRQNGGFCEGIEVVFFLGFSTTIN